MRRDRGTKSIFQNTKDEPFDTKKHQVSPEIECTHANELFGCLNGFPYDWEVIYMIYFYFRFFLTFIIFLDSISML